MLPAQHAERIRVEALNADGRAVHAGGAVGCKAAGLDAGGIGFERDLEVVGWVEQAACVGDQVGNGFRFHQARRAAAEEDRGQAAAPEPLRFPGQLTA